MSPGLIFIAGFAVGGFTVFIVTALTVWRPIVEDWKGKYLHERARRIEAEDNPNFAYLGAIGSAHDWGTPLDDLDQMTTGNPAVLDFTDLDDLPYADGAQ